MGMLVVLWRQTPHLICHKSWHAVITLDKLEPRHKIVKICYFQHQSGMLPRHVLPAASRRGHVSMGVSEWM